MDATDTTEIKSFRKDPRVRIALVLFCVYCFLVSIALMGAAFKGFGRGFAEALIQSTSNPFIGLFIGILSTSLVQSSSTTTSIAVGMVASGVLTVRGAIPIVMGANIGTTVTNTLVSFAHITRREEFKRAVSGATLHDFFNQTCVLIMFPLELTTHFLERLATCMANTFKICGGMKFTSPIKFATQPVVHFVEDFLLNTLHMPSRATYIIMLCLSGIILFTSLYFIVRLMKYVVSSKADEILDRTIGKHALLGLAIGLVFTTIVQSSSITTSLLVPLVGAGILSLNAVFPIVLGANIGTTTTAILASFATGNVAAVTIAFVHFSFNVCGALLIYPIKVFRRIPMGLARLMGEIAYKRRYLAVMYVTLMFFIIPISLILISRIVTK